MPSMMASKHIQLHCQTVRQKPEHSTQRNMQQTTPTLITRSFSPAAVFCNFFYFFQFARERLKTIAELLFIGCGFWLAPGLSVFACSINLRRSMGKRRAQATRTSPMFWSTQLPTSFPLRNGQHTCTNMYNRRSRKMFLYRKGRPAVNIQQQSSITVEQLPCTYQQPS